MRYRKDHPSMDIAIALGLEKSQSNRIDNAIAKAYDECPVDENGFKMDDINSIVAPYIKTAEEAFYAGIRIYSQLVAVMAETGAFPKMNNKYDA